jgi:hypothetical protein
MIYIVLHSYGPEELLAAAIANSGLNPNRG